MNRLPAERLCRGRPLFLQSSLCRRCADAGCRRAACQLWSASPCFCTCLSSPKRRLRQSAPLSIKVGSSLRWLSCADCFLASPTPNRRGHAPGQSQGGSHCVSRRVRQHGRDSGRSLDRTRANAGVLISHDYARPRRPPRVGVGLSAGALDPEMRATGGRDECRVLPGSPISTRASGYAATAAVRASMKRGRQPCVQHKI